MNQSRQAGDRRTVREGHTFQRLQLALRLAVTPAHQHHCEDEQGRRADEAKTPGRHQQRPVEVRTEGAHPRVHDGRETEELQPNKPGVSTAACLAQCWAWYVFSHVLGTDSPACSAQPVRTCVAILATCRAAKSDEATRTPLPYFFRGCDKGRRLKSM